MVAATGATGRVEDEDLDSRLGPRLKDSRRMRGDESGLAAVLWTGDSTSGTSSGTEKWWPACVAGGLKSTHT